MAKKRGIAADEAHTMIADVLPNILGDLADAIIRVGGVDKLLGEKQWHQAFPATTDPTGDNHFRNFLSMAIRPFKWFEAHFEKLLNVGLTSLEPVAPNLFYRDLDWCEAYVLRYEDIPVSMPIIAARLGIAEQFVLSIDNASSDKDFATEIRLSFQTDTAERLGTVFQETRYSRFFGY